MAHQQLPAQNLHQYELLLLLLLPVQHALVLLPQTGCSYDRLQVL